MRTYANVCHSYSYVLIYATLKPSSDIMDQNMPALVQFKNLNVIISAVLIECVHHKPKP